MILQAALASSFIIFVIAIVCVVAGIPLTTFLYYNGIRRLRPEKQATVSEKVLLAFGCLILAIFTISLIFIGLFYLLDQLMDFGSN